jgi:hypothetical protein
MRPRWPGSIIVSGDAPYMNDTSSYFHAPLSEEQIEEACAFGKSTSLSDDPYNISFPKCAVLLTVGTAFGRISAYARTMELEHKPLDRELINTINNNSDLRSGYSVQAISSHKGISIMRCMVKHEKSGRDTFHAHENMTNGSVSFRGGKFIQTGHFENPVYPTEWDFFEVAVLKFLGMTTERQPIPYPLR